jgi:predicted RNase H-like HicB family nuclease
LCRGVWATVETVEECRDALKDVLVEWLVSAYEDREPVPDTAELAWLSLYLHRLGD